MNYWFLYFVSNGSIYEAPYLGYANEWTNIPDGCAVLGPIAQSDATATDAWQNPQNYSVKNGVLVMTATAAQLLAQSQQQQIANINIGFNKTLAAGFTSNATGTTVVYGWQLQDQLDLQLVQTAVTQGIDKFPVAYGALDGSIISIQNQAVLTQLQTDANNFAWAQRTQLRTLLAQVQAQTSVPSTPVTWTAGAYTPQPAPTTA